MLSFLFTTLSDEPNYMKHTKCKRTTNGDRKCETKHVYKEKCTEILAFKPKGFSAKKGARGPKPSKGGLVQAEANGKVAHSVCTGNQAVKITAATYGQSCGAPNNNGECTVSVFSFPLFVVFKWFDGLEHEVMNKH